MLLTYGSFIVLLSLTPTFQVRREILSKDFVHSINQKKTTWTAGQNFPEDTPLEDLRRIASGLIDERIPSHVQVRSFGNRAVENLPAHFDAREKWPFCESVSEIRSQGTCGSCWAFGTTEAMTDRLCIQSNGTNKFRFSPEELLSCCTWCGDCNGGGTIESWNYWINEGIVSGGDANSNEGCLPYSPAAFSQGQTPACSRTCRSGYSVSYQDDKHYGSEMHLLPGSDLRQVQYEIMNYGPVEANYEVYEDFYNYKSGVYQYTQGNFVGRHVIKILGWGTENNVPYWLVANSWGADWGDHGFFKILRGSNHVALENYIFAGTPRMRSNSC